jgi:hypothetical protein
MGLRHLELNGMVIPLISIDEFEPKMGTTEEVIVISFFCRDELPAFDLDEFIDKSVVEFLDSEVSPNPNEDGLYLVFIEFKRQKFLVEVLRSCKRHRECHRQNQLESTALLS